MKYYNKFFPALVAGAVSLCVMTTSLHAETLDQAIQEAIQNHPSVTTAKTDSDIAAAQKREERSGYYPQVSISGSGGRIYGDNATSRGFTTTRGAGYSNYWDGSVTARQMLFDGFQTDNKVDSAKARKNSADLNLADVQERLALSTAQAYTDLIRARTGLEMIAAHAKKVSDYEDRIKKMVDDGASDEAEYQQAKDIRVILDNMTADYEGQLRTAQAYYTELTGNIPAEKLAPPMIRTDLIPGEVDEAIEYAKANNAGLKSAALMSKSAALDTQAEKGALYPDIDGEVSYLQSEKKDIIGGELTDARALLRLNWVFETGGGQLARIDQKKLREKEAESQTQVMERQIERTLRLAYSDYKTSAKQIDSQQKRYDLNKKLFETYNVQFEGGKITMLQLMQSDNQLFTTQLERMNGEYKMMAARFAILAGMGRLQESFSQDVAQADTRAPEPANVPTPTLTGLSADDEK